MSDAIALRIEPRRRDIGGLEVNRLLPHATCRRVGPFVFFDHMGPADFPAGHGIDVRPHPHIGLSTLTYLFEGEILHRDSLGCVQPIRPGDVNWMTAGRGIAHSERTGPDVREQGGRLDGIQCWLALPLAHEETAPAFTHHPAASLPRLERGGVRMTLIAGSILGETSPVEVFSDTFYLDVRAPAGAAVDVPDEHPERAAYVAHGGMRIDGEEIEAGTFAVFPEGAAVTLEALGDSRLMLLGGAPLEGPRHIWWNFVSSSRDRIEQAKADWREGRFAPVPGDDAFIPLPAD